MENKNKFKYEIFYWCITAWVYIQLVSIFGWFFELIPTTDTYSSILTLFSAVVICPVISLLIAEIFKRAKNRSKNQLMSIVLGLYFYKFLVYISNKIVEIVKMKTTETYPIVLLMFLVLIIYPVVSLLIVKLSFDKLEEL